MHPNIKIAIFMGYNIRQTKEGEYIRTFANGYGNQIEELTSPDCFFEYECSWFEQMQVINRIESMGYSTEIKFVPDKGHYVKIWGAKKIFQSGYHLSKQDAIYRAIIQFLERHARHTTN